MRTMSLITLMSLGALPLSACGLDRFDGRWVADVPPAENCCPTRVVMDIDGHKISGQTEDCHGVLAIGGKVDARGAARITVAGAPGNATFTAENFDASLPGDACHRRAVGNRGG